jgi:hypothetical protein
MTDSPAWPFRVSDRVAFLMSSDGDIGLAPGLRGGTVVGFGDGINRISRPVVGRCPLRSPEIEPAGADTCLPLVREYAVFGHHSPITAANV